MTFKPIKVSGDWKVGPNGIQPKVSGAWKTCAGVWKNVGGSWKVVYSPTPPFSPYTDTFAGNTSGTVTVPSGATQAVITIVGGGGGGASQADGGGGGAGARVVKTIAVVAGQTFDYNLAGSVTAGTNGIASTANNWSGGSLSLTANGGARGFITSGGAGGTGSGGDSNTTGGAGGDGYYEPETFTYFPGAGGVSGFPGGFGDGGAGGGNQGTAGRMTVDWS